MGKERFDRSEPHINLGTIVCEDYPKSRATSSIVCNISEMQKEIESLKEQLEEAREVIGFYGDEVNWKVDDSDDYFPVGHKRKIADDSDYYDNYSHQLGKHEIALGGKRARAFNEKYKRGECGQ